jgi:hypothetical protein
MMTASRPPLFRSTLYFNATILAMSRSRSWKMATSRRRLPKVFERLSRAALMPRYANLVLFGSELARRSFRRAQSVRSAVHATPTSSKRMQKAFPSKRARQFPIDSSSHPEMNSTQPAPIVPSRSGPFGNDLRSERQSARSDLLQLQTADDVLGHAAGNPHASRSACLSVPSLSAGGHHPAGLRPNGPRAREHRALDCRALRLRRTRGCSKSPGTQNAGRQRAGNV